MLQFTFTGKKKAKKTHEPADKKAMFMQKHFQFVKKDPKWPLTKTMVHMHAELPDYYTEITPKQTLARWAIWYNKELITIAEEKLKPVIKQKPGRKARLFPIGEVGAAWRGMKHPLPVYESIAVIIMAQVTAGVPLTLTIVKSLVLGYLATVESTWTPSTGWIVSFLKRLGRQNCSVLPQSQHKVGAC
jgi:hypothetical protein